MINVSGHLRLWCSLKRPQTLIMGGVEAGGGVKAGGVDHAGRSAGRARAPGRLSQGLGGRLSQGAGRGSRAETLAYTLAPGSAVQ